MPEVFLADRLALPDAENRLLARLINERYFDQADCETVRKHSEHNSIGLCAALLELGLVPEKALSAAIIAEFELPPLTPDLLPLGPILQDDVSVPYIKRRRVVPISLDSEVITLAVQDPFDTFSWKAFSLLTGRQVALTLGSQSELDELIQTLYGGGRSSVDEIVEDLRGDSSAADLEAQRLVDLASEAPVVRLVNLLIARSVDAGASDIHFEVYEKKLQVRYRIDGVLHDLETPPQHAAPAITSRVKILAKLNIAERRLPQDGRIRLTIRGKIVDFRVSIVPTLHGERIVMRVLDRNATPKSFDDLGLSKDIQGKLAPVLRRPNGIFLVTGPTGSGKTTTLYASLLTLPAKEKNILTVEDPIEYQLQNINQIQVRPSIGLTFAAILRSILRQDPDIVLVGEIRDQETADIAVHAALTGHLVLSTLHTNTAAGAMARLLDMGIEGYLLTTAIQGVMAQRLVRCLCELCKERMILGEENAESRRLRALAGISGSKTELAVYRPRGCRFCSETGYRGRSAIAEMLLPSDRLRQLVLQRAPAQEIHAAAVSDGMVPMIDDGLRKVLAGITSLEEVYQAVSDVA